MIGDPSGKSQERVLLEEEELERNAQAIRTQLEQLLKPDDEKVGSIRVMNNVMHPHAFNVGMNIGRTAGAGIDEHLHYHIVPRWDGDTNFMPVISDTKVVSESLQATFKKLKTEFQRLYGEK